MAEGEQAVPREPLPRPAWLRLALLAAVLMTLLVLGHATGLTSHLGTREVRERTLAAGYWGPVLYVAVFTGGELVHVPGIPFVIAAVVVYGRVTGALLAFVGAVVSLSVSFVIVRSIGGKPLGAIRWGFVQRLLAALERRPIRTIVVLRLLLWMTPQLNYALALSNVRFRDYFVGSAVGLVLPIFALAWLFDKFTFLLERFAP